ncbi:CHAD domain-containing protein [Pseudoflavitalea sp. G-6-1-2]|uniref:CHAD domain-containing protein n=1 Tax=Pseudoflavitalea sp. G-6-1-2 TaxID=2728841 RepID=UPI00146CFFD6|nr:CHAD domain-containing protein [Pseudoflavitalea sp. G-6-1-2]NML19392.1 CHAD domain-containing protein [Pseudoflavitalea sp. G-6-1-2]
MKKQLAKVVNNYGRTIQHLCREIPGEFKADMIHDLRVAYKKLRAFIRLLQVADRKLQLPDDLKLIYRSCGTVRDLQLVLEKLEPQEDSFPKFIKSLHHDLFLAKELLVLNIEDVSVSSSIKELREKLPSKIDEDTVRQFVQQKIASIKILLLALEHEEELHGIRKALKDLIYVKKILKEELPINYPFNEWKSDQKLLDLTTLLGDLNDKYIALSYFDEDSIQHMPDEEQLQLKQLQQHWTEEKDQLQLKAMTQVKTLQRYLKQTN